MLLYLGTEGLALAQPQDDAALADAPDERPAVSASPVSPTSPGNDERPPAADEQKEADRPPPMTTAELRRAYPDLQVRDVPPLTLGIYVNSVYPLQTFGLGVGLEVYALPRLRLSVMGAVGASQVANDEWSPSFYTEASMGVVLLRGTGRTVAELPSSASRHFRSKRTAFDRFMLGEEQPPAELYDHALVPTSHSLELEGGLFSGLYPLYRCTAQCDQDPTERTKADASRQVTLLFAGVRYVYYRWARSRLAPFRTLAGFEAAVDAIHNPVAPVDPQLFNLYNTHPSHDPIGVRVNLRFRGVKCTDDGPCVGFNLMGGYLPSPSDGLFSANIEVE